MIQTLETVLYTIGLIAAIICIIGGMVVMINLAIKAIRDE
jgi:hypothetical protein